jgi:hypothetical protein
LSTKRNPSTFHVTDIGFQVWGILIEWNAQTKIPVPWDSIYPTLRPHIKPGTRWTVKANLEAKSLRGLHIHDFTRTAGSDLPDELLACCKNFGV